MYLALSRPEMQYAGSASHWFGEHGVNTILTLLDTESPRAFYRAGFWRDETIYALARGHADRAPGAMAFRERHRRTCYRDLVDAADSLAADLHRHGVRPGQRVAVWLPGRVEVAVALLAREQ